RLERETLVRLLAERAPERGMVLATGGSLVHDREAFQLLKQRATTVWLKARPEDHWNRVIRQADRPPMAQHPHAMSQLRALLAARERFYGQAQYIVDTSHLTVSEALEGLLSKIGRSDEA